MTAIRNINVAHERWLLMRVRQRRADKAFADNPCAETEREHLAACQAVLHATEAAKRAGFSERDLFGGNDQWMRMARLVCSTVDRVMA